MTVHDWLAQWSAWGWPLLANHLWQATLFWTLAFVAISLLKRGPANTRHTIWLIAALKFAAPSAMLVFLLERAGLNLSALFGPAPEGAATLAAVGQLTAPVYEWVDGGSVSPIAAAGHNELYCALTLTWLSGVAVFLGMWFRRRRQFLRRLMAVSEMTKSREEQAMGRALMSLGKPLDIRLMVSSGAAEPGVWRVFSPVIVLPSGMSDHLSDAELDAVLLHELVHVVRRDNLQSNLQMMLCCIFWFHPLVWVLDRSLLNERERACDEAVIKLGGQTEVYASSLLKVLRFCLGWKVAGISYAAGSNLGRRVERIMANNNDQKLRILSRIVVGVISIVIVAFSIAAGFMSRKQAVIHADAPQSSNSQAASRGIPGRVAVGEGVVAVPQDSDINQRLTQAPDTIVRFDNSKSSPVSITAASLKVIKFDDLYPGREDGSQSRDQRWLIRPSLTLFNNADRSLSDLSIELENEDGIISSYYVHLSWMVEPKSTFVLNNRFVTFKGDPASIVVRVPGGIFQDGSIWGTMVPPPPPPPPPPPRPRRAGDDREPALDESSSRVVRKAGGVLQGSATKRVQPEYPERAKDNGVSGAVVIEVLVNEVGDVSSARVVSGHPDLAEAAVNAARGWKFTPTTLNGDPVKVIGTITFNFSL